MEAAGLGLFMISAGTFGTLLWHPNSPVVVTGELLRLFLMGGAMGLTAIALIYSPWGKRSGAHLNPAVTLALLYLRKIAPIDAAFYIVAQFVGGLAGVLLTASAASALLGAPPTWYVPTVPGKGGVLWALAAEWLMSAGMMAMALVTSDSPRLKQLTGVFAGALLTLYIVLGAHVSGMSINPARTVASAVPSGIWTSVWIYFVGPGTGMLAVAAIYRGFGGGPAPACAGMNQHAAAGCVARCAAEYWNEAGGIE
jgi:aquaporin Z